MRAAPEDVLGGPVERVAPRLLGGVLRHGEVAIRVTEVEAYASSDDPASHASRGPSPRNRAMFGPPGHLYVYFTYGMHFCANVVTGPDGTAAACLIRAGQVVDGMGLAQERRGRSSERDLARGPARLCQALALDLAHDGVDLLGAATPSLTLAADPPSPAEVCSGPRVGVRRAAGRPWRFWLSGDPTVSRYRPAKGLPPRSTPI